MICFVLFESLMCNIAVFIGCSGILGVAPIPAPLEEVKTGSRSPISLVNLFELVADDLIILNNNLQSVSTSWYLFLVETCYAN